MVDGKSIKMFVSCATYGRAGLSTFAFSGVSHEAVCVNSVPVREKTWFVVKVKSSLQPRLTYNIAV